jgi:hypothetical protein
MEMTTSKFALLMVAAGLTLLISLPASAQEAGGAAAAEKPAAEGDGYGYEFSDDPLNAGGFGPNDATIKVRPRAARTTLIRPRTSFVTEMLKSVENI